MGNIQIPIWNKSKKGILRQNFEFWSFDIWFYFINKFWYEYNYYVPQKNNNPDGCTIYLEISGGVGAPEGAIHVGGNKYKIEGIKNFCADPPKGEKPYGCDPYNCHQRV